MRDLLLPLLLFFAKAIIIVAMLLAMLAGILSLIRNKEKLMERITIKHLNDEYASTRKNLLHHIWSKKKFKQWLKDEKEALKIKSQEKQRKNIFLIDFKGDIKASAVTALRETVTAIIQVATPEDEVVVRLESPGGMVHSYGLAAAQLLRLREHSIPLTVSVDKIAASGGYLMAAVANKIIAAPFSIIGSIGVLFQLPNLNRLLKDKKIDFEQITAGHYKRTLTVFGTNTDEGREKCREEIEEIHARFKDWIQRYRPQVDIEKVATGEHWLGSHALELHLIDQIQTSDDWLLENSTTANLYEISFYTKKSLGEKVSSTLQCFYFNRWFA